MNLLDFLFPKRCVGCGRIGRYFCLSCSLRIRHIAYNEMICPMCEGLAIDGRTHPKCRTKYGIDGLTSFFRYDGIIRKAVKAIKYRRVSDLSSEFVSLIPQVSVCFGSLFRVDTAIFVPIPMHPSRQRVRGFNQAEVLGRSVAAQLNLPVETGMLRRVKQGMPQVDMRTRKERLGNMKHVFQAEKSMKNSNVVLFDDVFTTGATMRSAAHILKRSGATYVWAVTMAR